jgi:hypothetical protein
LKLSFSSITTGAPSLVRPPFTCTMYEIAPVSRARAMTRPALVWA